MTFFDVSTRKEMHQIVDDDHLYTGANPVLHNPAVRRVFMGEVRDKIASIQYRIENETINRAWVKYDIF